MIPWYERGRPILGEPYRPQLRIAKEDGLFIFSVREGDEYIHTYVPVEHAAKCFHKLTTQPPYYVRERGDRQSSDWFTYLNHCALNHKVPNGEDYERILHLSTGR